MWSNYLIPSGDNAKNTVKIITPICGVISCKKPVDPVC